MQLDKSLEYYRKHGLITCPGTYADEEEKLPTNILKLCEAIHHLILIDFLPNMGLVQVPQENLQDVNIRGIEGKLKGIISRDNASILNERSFEKISLGNCRDLSLLMCSVLRNHKIPARLRSGFGTFFHPEKMFDHWVCEYWDEFEKRWIRVDPWMSQIQYRKGMLPSELSDGLLKLDLNPYDVQKEYFITGGEAWINCRENGHDPDKYGTYAPHLKGLWFIRDNMIRDLLCLNKIEPLAWDCWGLMGMEKNNIQEEELILLDEIARFLNRSDFTESSLNEKLESLNIKDDMMKSIG